MTSDTFNVPRALSLRFEMPLPHEGEVTIPPPSLQQLADSTRLDPKKQGQAHLDRMVSQLRSLGYTVEPPAEPIAGFTPMETDGERILRLQRQARILLGPAHDGLVEKLPLSQILPLISALYLTCQGQDPTDFVAVQALLDLPAGAGRAGSGRARR